MNFYVYAGNDAVNNVDPSGHIFWYLAAAGAFAAADLAFQLGNNNHNLDCVDWGEVAEAGLFGLGIGELAAGAFAVEGAGALEAAEAEEACAGGACEGGACFAPETKVATADGEVAIADIKVGDKVWSKDETTGETTLEVVARRYVTPNEQLLDLDVSADGREELIRATPAHPFWVDGQGWTSAGDLRAGDQFDLRSGKHAVLARIEKETRRSSVYNLEVAGSHSYFVGDDGVWVHNGCGGAAASDPVGGRGQQNSWPNPDAPQPRNDPANIGGQDFSGHAVDRMQERGIPPSAVLNAIENGEASPGKIPGTTDYWDPVNEIKVVTNSGNGTVITLW